MKEILRGNLSKRFGFDGWACVVEGATSPLWYTFSTTREECRQVRESFTPDLFNRITIEKVRIKLEVVK